MISAATTMHLVARRHVDLGRTRSMICRPWHAWPPSTTPGARSPARFPTTSSGSPQRTVCLW